MNIDQNFFMLIEQFTKIFSSLLNKTLIVSCSAQIASMIAKLIINSIKNRKLTAKNMATYGGMPSSHTVFIMSWVFAVALDPNIGWKSEILSFGIVVSSIILMDAVRFRGTVDKINQQLRALSEKNPELGISMPKLIAHKTSEVLGGILFAFVFTFLFYLFFYDIFNR